MWWGLIYLFLADGWGGIRARGGRGGNQRRLIHWRSQQAAQLLTQKRLQSAVKIMCENHALLTVILSAHAHTYLLLVCERRLFPEVLITFGHKHEELHGLSINPQPLEYALHVPARQGDEGEGKMSRGAWAD